MRKTLKKKQNAEKTKRAENPRHVRKHRKSSDPAGVGQHVHLKSGSISVAACLHNASCRIARYILPAPNQ